MRRFQFFIRVGEGVRLPKLYGITQYNFEDKTETTCPIPFNLVVRLAIRIYHWIVISNPTLLEKDRWKVADAVKDKAFRSGVVQGTETLFHLASKGKLQ